jgi:hypothetical protein
MQSVWQGLERELKAVAELGVHEKLKAEFPGIWLKGYLLIAITAGHDISIWDSAPTLRKQDELLQRIEDYAGKLLTLLRLPSIDERSFTAWDALNAAVGALADAPEPVQQLFRRLKNNTRGRYWERSNSDGTGLRKEASTDKDPFPFSLQATVLLGDLLSQLTGLAELARIARERPNKERSYHRKKTRHLERMLYRDRLVQYLQGIGLQAKPPKSRQGGFPLYRMVAITTNVALGLSGRDQLKSDTARKSPRKSTSQ